MKQTIEIEAPEGKKAVWKDGKVILEEIKPQLPKTWKGFCGEYMNSEYFIGIDSEIERLPLGYIYDPYSDKNLLPSRKAAEQHLALMQLHQLRDCYRQGWKFESVNADTHSIKNFVDLYRVVPTNLHNLFLTFQTKEIAEEFLNNFRDLIEQAGDLI